jgi:Zn finger protein HypA/HybF involved in hydrogenase expression
MNPELEKFIDFAVADGEVTDKEKAILIRKAEEFGVELDEMEMVLNAKLHMIQKEAQPKEGLAEVTPHAENKPSVAKCPQCAAAIESFSTICPYCDAELRDIKASKTISELHADLTKAEVAGEDEFKNKGFMEKLTNNFNSQSHVIKKKISILNSYPIPNTKEDILEFLVLAKSNVKGIKIDFSMRMMGAGHKDNHIVQYRQAWIGKCDQIIAKARFSMKDDKSLLNEIESYAKELKIK